MTNTPWFLRPLILVVLWCGVLANTQAQTDLMSRLQTEEQEALATLVLYPEEFRTAILEATLYPEALINMQRLQNRTSESFRSLLSGYSQEDQTLLWDLSRYQELVYRLATEAYGNPNLLSAIISDYPEPVQAKAREAMRKHASVLWEMNSLLQQAESDFETLLAYYPPDAKNTLRQLMDLPEALTLLNEHIEMTILLGNSYRNAPLAISRELDELHLEVARQQAEELANWQESVRNDPQAMAELEQAATEFRGEYGYDDAYYNYEPVQREVVIYHHYSSYPYWFGYPYWYEYPRWRPVPVWYDFGFQLVTDRSITIVRLPSPFFVRWYFYQPHHHYRYPHLSDRFVHHTYYGARTYGSSITTSVRYWQRTNREVISERWLRDENQRVERLREFGQFEAERERVNSQTPTRQRSQTEFLAEKQNRYPNLRNYQEEAVRASRQPVPKTQAAQQPTTRPTEPQRDRTILQAPTERQKVEPPKSERPRVEPRIEPKVRERTKVEPRTTQKPKPTVQPRKQTTTKPTTKTTKPATKTKTTKKKGGGG